MFYFYLDIYRRALYSNEAAMTQSQLDQYYRIGWGGMALIFFYNIFYICYQIVDIVIGCKYTNWERMEVSRREYYAVALAELEETQGLLGK